MAAVRRFWLDGMRWTPFLEAEDEVLMIRVGEHLLLSLWALEHFTAEVGTPQGGPGVPPVTLAHDVASVEEVDTVLAEARAAGALSVTPGRHRDWGGYSGYFVDPAGFAWEVAWAPGPVSDVVLPGRPPAS
nr:VOC family protein [Auraticoccus cholistanensis]